jgi:hypothetical protein
MGEWTTEQVVELAPIFRRHLAEDGIDVEVCGHFILMRTNSAIDATSVSPQSMDGQSLRDVLPTGADATIVRRLLTELQMLLQQRYGEGAETNAVWLWGGGSVPKPSRRDLPPIYSDDGFAKGIYIVHEQVSKCFPPPASYRSIAGQDVVVVLNVDIDASLRAIEDRWFEPALQALHRRELQRVELYLDGATVRSSCNIWKRLTSRPRAIGEVLP